MILASRHAVGHRGVAQGFAQGNGHHAGGTPRGPRGRGARDACDRPGVGHGHLVGGFDTRPQLAARRAQIGAEPAHDQRGPLDVRQRSLQIADRRVPVASVERRDLLGIDVERTKRAIVLVTHYQRLLNYIEPDRVHVLSKGRIVHSGDKSLALELEKRGYDWVREVASA